MKKRFLLATSLLAGTIIGAGIFSLPYVVSRLGILYGFFCLIFFTAVYFVIHLMYARVIQVKESGHQFFYFAHLYFKKPLAIFASWAIFAELVFVLVVYLVLAPVFVNLIFPASGFVATLLFWVIGSIFIFVGLKGLGLAEFFGAFGILAVVLMIFFVSLSKPLLTSLVQPFSWSLFFLPFGPMLFSLAGRPAIHKLVDEWRLDAKATRPFSVSRAVFWGTIIPALIYGIFIVGILKLNPVVSPEAVDSLGFLSSPLLAAIAVAGLLALWTSYFVIAVNVKEILKIDLKLKSSVSALVTVFAPLALYFIGFKDFLSVLSFTGGIFLSLEGIFVITMWRRAFPNHRFKFLTWPLYLVFGLAVVYELGRLIL